MEDEDVCALFKQAKQEMKEMNNFMEEVNQEEMAKHDTNHGDEDPFMMLDLDEDAGTKNLSAYVPTKTKTKSLI